MQTADSASITPDEWIDRIGEAQDALKNSPYRELREATCRFSNGQLVLSGHVPSFYLKQLAQTLLLQLSDCTIPVDNRLKVQLDNRPQRPSAAATAPQGSTVFQGHFKEEDDACADTKDS